MSIPVSLPRHNRVLVLGTDQVLVVSLKNCMPLSPRRATSAYSMNDSNNEILKALRTLLNRVFRLPKCYISVEDAADATILMCPSPVLTERGECRKGGS